MADTRVLPTAEWAATVALALADRLRLQPTLRLCLPTGSTPAPLYDELVAAATSGALALGHATVVLLDEYVGLPAGDPARCDGTLRRQLIERLPEPRPELVAIRVDELPAEEAAAAHDRAAMGLDLALVGLGRNGHVGFNEPGSTADSPTRAVELTPESIAASAEYGAQDRPTLGITVGLTRLLEAGELWLLVTGAHKASILRAALAGPETADVPASFLRRHPRLSVFADDAAAALLQR